MHSVKSKSIFETEVPFEILKNFLSALTIEEKTMDMQGHGTELNHQEMVQCFKRWNKKKNKKRNRF